MLIPKMSEAAEKKLASALSTVSDEVNRGTHPNDAIAKVASAQQIPHGHIPLMVHAYNTGRSLNQIRHGGSLLEKAADFPLAETPVVMERLYPTNVPTPAELKQASDVSDDYS